MAHLLLKISHSFATSLGEKETDSLDFTVEHLLQLKAIRVIKATVRWAQMFGEKYNLN
jgi:hypothetical protein